MQAAPTYPLATGKQEEPIVRALIGKYGLERILWPIVLSQGDTTIAYLYEKNANNGINAEHDTRPPSAANLPGFFLDYTSQPRRAAPPADFLRAFLDERYGCSYDYVPGSTYSTVDLDYVWNTGNGFRGFELTTFWMDFHSHQRASELVAKMNRRPSWQGPNGAHALRKIVDSAADLGIDYYLVCLNTESKVGSAIKTSGNVYFFRLTHGQIDRLSRGMPPMDANFCSFEQFLGWL